VTAIFGGGDKEAFKATIKDKLAVIERIYAKYATDATYASVSKKGKPLWDDAAMFNFARDMILTELITKDDLPPRVKRMYDAFLAIPAVNEYCSKKK